MIAEAEAKKTIAENKKCRKILFVCTGNTCRSPMAEAVFNRFYGNGESIAFSAGLCADGSPISANAKFALRSLGIKDFEHTSVTVTEEMMSDADLVVGLTASHADSLIMKFPEYCPRITCFEKSVSDPYGGSEERYKVCLSEIKAEIDKMFGGKTDE